MVKGVIFDFNGTLFYDTPQQEKAWREVRIKVLGIFPILCWLPFACLS